MGAAARAVAIALRFTVSKSVPRVVRSACWPQRWSRTSEDASKPFASVRVSQSHSAITGERAGSASPSVGQQARQLTSRSASNAFRALPHLYSGRTCCASTCLKASYRTRRIEAPVQTFSISSCHCSVSVPLPVPMKSGRWNSSIHYCAGPLCDVPQI